jgi:DNA-directed RNA polymerase subunit N (RpoN/RPB10)
MNDAPPAPSVPKPEGQMKWDPYEDIRDFILPVRCTNAGNGCTRVLGNKQFELERMLNEGKTWDEIFDKFQIPPSQWCCRRSLQAFNWTYTEVIPSETLYGRNELNADNAGIYSNQLLKKSDMQFSNWYRSTKRGVVHTGYGPNNTAVFADFIMKVDVLNDVAAVPVDDFIDADLIAAELDQMEDDAADDLLDQDNLMGAMDELM